MSGEDILLQIKKYPVTLIHGFCCHDRKRL